MDHGQIDQLISNMLNNGLIYDKPSKKGTSYFIMEATNNDLEKAGDNADVVNIGNNNCFARCSTLHHHIKILIVQPRNLKLLQSFLHHK